MNKVTNFLGLINFHFWVHIVPWVKRHPKGTWLIFSLIPLAICQLFSIVWFGFLLFAFTRTIIFFGLVAETKSAAKIAGKWTAKKLVTFITKPIEIVIKFLAGVYGLVLALFGWCILLGAIGSCGRLFGILPHELVILTFGGSILAGIGGVVLFFKTYIVKN